MTAPVFINGRFLGQAVTGVQRFSLEITSAIDGLMADGEWPETVMLTPRSRMKSAGTTTRAYDKIGLREVGRQRGHAWEQMDLPHAARHGTLVSLGNTAPFFAGRRQVVVIHDAGVFDTPDSYSLRFRLWYKGLQHALVRAGAKIVTVSEFSRGRIATRLGLDPAQVAVMYEGADHILGVVPDQTTLARHGLEPGRFALVVGSSVAHKNLDALREVSAALAKRDMVIAIVGGSNAEVFQDIGASGSIGKRLGRSTDAELRALYESAACLLFPSRYEGFGLPPVEAMACGCPVIASRGGAVEEICKDAALYVDTRDGAALVGAVEALLDTPGLAANFVARGHHRVAGMTWEAAARALADVVRPLC